MPRHTRKRRRKTAKKKRPVPTNKALYARVKAEAKRKFKVYPSACLLYTSPSPRD